MDSYISKSLIAVHFFPSIRAMSLRPTSPSLFHPSRATDISRILDPSYSSSSASSYAYVDRNGDLHDPDYRHFPIAHPPKRHTSHTMSRPRWELIDEDALDIEEDQYDIGEYPIHGRNKRPTSFSSSSRLSPTYSYHPQPHHNSPDSDDTVFDEYEEFEHEAFVEKEKHPRRTSSVSHILKNTRTKFATPPHTTKDRKRWSSTTLPDDATTVTVLSVSDSLFPSPSSHHHPLPASSTHQYQEKEEKEQERSEMRARDLEREIEGERWTPTCTQALRREWQAVSLRIRFSVFRAQRKVKKRIASLT